MLPINLEEKFALINEYWSPKIVAELNGQHIKLVKVLGELIWHSHENEDELFYVNRGQIMMCFEAFEKTVKAGEILIVPKGIRHKPIAIEECWMLLFEPIGIKHTGDERCEKTLCEFEWL